MNNNLRQQSLFPPETPIPLMTVDDIYMSANQLLLSQLKEDRRIEIKSAGIHAKELGEYFSMWANTNPDGGLIVVGIENDTTLTGCLKVSQDHINQLEKAGYNFAPEAKYEHKRVSVTLPNKKIDYVLLIRVYYRESGGVVKTTNGQAFLRVGDSKTKLTDAEIREIEIDRGHIDFEKEPCGLLYPDDFNVELIAKYVNKYVLNRQLAGNHTTEDILQISHLGKINQHRFIPNNACALLFAKDPKEKFPGCKIRFLRFDGETEGTGEKWNAVKDIWVDGGSVPSLIVETEKVLDAQVREFSRFGSDGIFYTHPEYPKAAWYETIVNASVHRSYTQRNMPIMVKMFDNRLVIESPGSFPPLVTPENIYDMHNPRNPHLMTAMYYLDFVKCAHEGTRRIRDTMQTMNLPKPTFEQKEINAGLVRVTLQNDIRHRKVWVDKDASEILGISVSSTLSETEKRIVNFIAEHEKISVSQAQRLTGKSWHTCKKILKSLEDRNIVFAKRSSALPNGDPGARYFLESQEDS